MASVLPFLIGTTLKLVEDQELKTALGFALVSEAKEFSAIALCTRDFKGNKKDSFIMRETPPMDVPIVVDELTLKDIEKGIIIYHEYSNESGKGKNPSMF